MDSRFEQSVKDPIVSRRHAMSKIRGDLVPGPLDCVTRVNDKEVRGKAQPATSDQDLVRGGGCAAAPSRKECRPQELTNAHLDAWARCGSPGK
jgi:hypothetical protein